MGVGRQTKDVFFSPYVQDNDMQILENQSGQSTDEEDVATSSNQAAHSFPRHRRARQRSSSVEACLTGMYRRCGARQARRTENIKYLLSLKVEGEESSDSQTPGYTSNTSAFAQILQERSKMQAWNSFVNSSEEDQERILNMRRSAPSLCSITEEHDVDDDDDGEEDSWEKVDIHSGDGHGDDKRSVHPSFTAAQAFERLDKNLRSILTRRHLPLGVVSQLERDVVEVFRHCPGSVYVSEVSSSFERLLLHAVCQFLGLSCKSFDEDGQRRTQVENKESTFRPPSESLAHFLEHLS